MGLFFPFLNLGDIALVFCDKPEKAKLLLDNVERGEISILKTIVLMEPFDGDLLARGKKCGVDILGMNEMEVSPALTVQRASSFQQKRNRRSSYKN